MKRLTSVGDTIVEVLIALTIISLVLGGAYVSASRSLNNGRQAQERGEALKLVQSQIERLKFIASGSDNTIFTTPNYFCISPTNAIVDAFNPTRAMATTVAVAVEDFSQYTSPDCKGQGLGQLFNLSVRRDPLNVNQFTASARWERAGSAGREELTIVYRVY